MPPLVRATYLYCLFSRRIFTHIDMYSKKLLMIIILLLEIKLQPYKFLIRKLH